MLTRVLRTVRLDTIDRRSQVGVALRRMKADLVAQLGGEDVMTPALNLLVEEACKKAVIVEVVGNWLLTQDTLVREHPEHGPQLLRVVEQHDRLQATLANLLDRIGYERKAQPVEDLATYIRRRDAEKAAAQGNVGGT